MQGQIEVICGSMFSGKTEELIRRVNRAKFAKQKTQHFKPKIDIRYHQTEIVSHNHKSITSTTVSVASEILKLIEDDTKVVVIDEAQFMDGTIIPVCELLANKGIRVIVAGLDMDSNCSPFGFMPQLMAIAESVTKINAVCVNCGNASYVSHRLSKENDRILLGEKDKYEPLCRSCYNTTRKNNNGKQ
jgi:thymidine kinase